MTCLRCQCPTNDDPCKHTDEYCRDCASELRDDGVLFECASCKRWFRKADDYNHGVGQDLLCNDRECTAAYFEGWSPRQRREFFLVRDVM
jgi:hypothetical protein